MANTSLVLRVVVDHAKLAKLINKAIAKIEAAPEEKRVEIVSEWVARIANDCVRFETKDDVQHLPKDS